MSNAITILSVPVLFADQQEIEDRIGLFFSERKAHRIVTVNPEFLVESSRNQAYRRLLQRADLATADGMGIVIAAWFLGYRVRARHRMTGVMLTELLLRFAEEQHKTVLIVLKSDGLSRADDVARAVSRLFPQLRYHIVTEDASDEQLATTKADVLCAALGCPDQDFYVQRAIDTIPTLRIGIGVGGTFDLLSGKIRRAPHIFRSMGLEWLWRLLMQPRRLRRILRAVIVFPYLVLRHR